MTKEGEITLPTEDPTSPNPNDNGDELEEGEIVEGGPAAAVPRAVVESHPLEHSWTFWFDNPSAKTKQIAWGTALGPIYTFSTVEQFWGLYNNIRCPSNLAVGADLYCFKDKIEPKWEDPICANGGKWGLNFPRLKSDTPWLYTLLAMIGEQFDHGDEICGAVVNVRGKQERLGLWTKNAANEIAQISIGRQWKEFLDCNESIGFVVHDDSKKLDRNAKNRYTV